MSRHLIILVHLALLASFRPANAIEPESGNKSQFTHVIANDTVYYTTSPAQGRPPDGTFKAGTKVKLLKDAGSYSRVRAEDGTEASVSTEALQKIEEAKGVRIIARSNNQFACDLYRHLHEQDGNLFFSPASISTALAMTYAGAEGMTESQMAKVLHFERPELKVHEAISDLSGVLNRSDKGYTLRMANRLWAQEGYEFRPEFLKVTRDFYGAELAQVDFARQAEKARQEINAWVEKETEDKIKDLIPSGILDEMTRLVLTNAIYFKGKWQDEFSKDATREAPFQISKDMQTIVPMMHQTEDFRYAATETLQVLELPYAGNDLSMIVLLPKKVDGLTEIEGSLKADNLDQWLTDLRKQEVRVYLPRFKLTAQSMLAGVLRSMGMTAAFSEQADFSGMATSEDLMISEVIHKAFVDVNEEGTEAAAATGVVIGVTSALIEPEPVVFRADHPFMFLIRDKRTEAILFLGRMVKPE